MDGHEVAIENGSEGGGIRERSLDRLHIRGAREATGRGSMDTARRKNSAHMNNVPELGACLHLSGLNGAAWASVRKCHQSAGRLKESQSDIVL